MYAYELITERFGHGAGTVCYESSTYDYGMAREDTYATGEDHISVSLRPDGCYPFFTVPLSQLKRK